MIETVPHKNFNTIGLVRFAENDVAERLKKNEQIDYVWIFFDKDSFPLGHYNSAYSKIIGKNKQEYKNSDGDNTDNNGLRRVSAWSNECFELWVILHFEFLTAALHRSQYPQIIDKYLTGEDRYEKKRTDLYDLLSKNGGVKRAINGAKKLHAANGINNPSTGIYQFLVYFDQYLNPQYKSHSWLSLGGYVMLLHIINI